MNTLLYYLEFESISATPLCNYSLLYVLPLHVNCIIIKKLVEYKLLFPVAILYYLLTICYYISYVFHEVLLTKRPTFEHGFNYCTMDS